MPSQTGPKKKKRKEIDVVTEFSLEVRGSEGAPFEQIDFEVAFELDAPGRQPRDMWEQITRAAHVTAEAAFEAMVVEGEKFADLLLDHDIKSDELFAWAPQWYLRWLRFIPEESFAVRPGHFSGFKPKESLIGQKASEMDLVVGRMFLEPWSRFALGSSVAMPSEGGVRISSVQIPVSVGIGAVILSGIEFEEGSVIPRLSMKTLLPRVIVGILGSAFVQQAAVTFVAPVGQTIALHQRVKDHYARVPLKFHDFRYSEADLRHYGEDLFNYNQSGISDYEKKQRKGLVQLAAAVGSQTNLEIDGGIGPDTTSVLNAIARANGFKEANINDRAFRRVLYEILIPEGHLW